MTLAILSLCFFIIGAFVLEFTFRMYRGMPLSRNDGMESILCLRLLAEARRKGEPAEPIISPQLILSTRSTEDPFLLSGYPESLVAASAEDEGFIFQRTDIHGFRNKPGLYEPGLHAMLMGDSYAEGASVPDGNTISEVMVRQCGFPVYNAGVSGCGLLHMLSVFQEYAPSVKPQWCVFLVMEGITLNRVMHEIGHAPYANAYSGKTTGLVNVKPDFRRALLDQYVKTSLIERVASLYEAEMNSSFSMSKFMVAQWVRTGFRRIPSRVEIDFNAYRGEKMVHEELLDQKIDILGQTMGMAIGLAGEWGGRVALAYAPNLLRFTRKDFTDVEYKAVMELSKKADMHFIDIVATFGADPDPQGLFALRGKWDPHAHFNRRGHCLVGEVIADSIR